MLPDRKTSGVVTENTARFVQFDESCCTIVHAKDVYFPVFHSVLRY